MKKHPLIWYSLAALLVVAPFGLRVLTWPAPRYPTVCNRRWPRRSACYSSTSGRRTTRCARAATASALSTTRPLVPPVTTWARPRRQRRTRSQRHDVRAAVAGKRRQDVREGVVHAHAVKNFQETLKDLDPRLPAISQPALSQLLPPPPRFRGCAVVVAPNQLDIPQTLQFSQRNTPALFGARLIDAIPEHVIIAGERRQRLQSGGVSPQTENEPVGRVLYLANGRVGRFGWKRAWQSAPACRTSCGPPVPANWA